MYNMCPHLEHGIEETKATNTQRNTMIATLLTPINHYPPKIFYTKEKKKQRQKRPHINTHIALSQISI